MCQTLPVNLPAFEPPLREPRRLVGWILLALLIFVVSVATIGLSYSADQKGGIDRESRLLFKEALARQALSDMQSQRSTGQNYGKVAANLLKDLPPRARQGSVYLALKYLAGEPVTEKELETLDTKASDANEALYALLNAKDDDPDLLRQWAHTLEDGELEHQAVATAVLQKLGESGSAQPLFSHVQVVLVAAGSLLLVVLALVGLVLWGVYLHHRSNSKLLPERGVLPFISLGTADGLVFRACIALLALLSASALVVPFAHLLSEDGAELASLLITLAVVLVVIQWRAWSSTVGLKELLGRSKPVGRYVGWGFIGEIAGIPILLLAVLGSVALRSVAPDPSHPAAETLLSNPTPFAVFNVFFGACIMAPLLEEFIFRGLILSAFLRVMRPASAILLNGFAFAAIHPQGIAGIPALMAIGVILAMMTYQTGSLIPAITGHALSNFTVLCLNLLMN